MPRDTDYQKTPIRTTTFTLNGQPLQKCGTCNAFFHERSGICPICQTEMIPTRKKRKNRKRPSKTKRILKQSPYLHTDPCAYCDRPGTTIDHITPRSQGGATHWLNSTAACRECNQAKADKPLLLHMLEVVA